MRCAAPCRRAPREAGRAAPGRARRLLDVSLTVAAGTAELDRHRRDVREARAALVAHYRSHARAKLARGADPGAQT